MRYLGIDYGSKRIGLSVGDESNKIAFPREVIPSEAQSADRIKEFCKAEKIDAIVLGESRDYKGNPNPIQGEIEKFKIELERATGLPVHYSRETLSSAEAARSTGKERLDASAAALILQSFLDRL